MNSPFPGMDPYLQRHWRDVHASLIIYARDQLQPSLPRDLVARVEERVCLESEDEVDRSFYPDVRVVERPVRKGGASTDGGVEIAEPVIVKFRTEPFTETYLEIRDASSGNRVVTFVEFVSPTNKTPGDSYDKYRQKQKDAAAAGVSLVEIDLILGGKRVVSVPLSRIPFKKRTRYQAIVRRGWKWNEAEVFPLPIYQSLLTIPVPLRQKDDDAPLNLQALLNQAYVNGGYDSINYADDCDPPLEGNEAEWADQLLRDAGKRK